MNDPVLLKPDPIAQFLDWYQEARQQDFEAADVMALATSDSQSAPSVRYVLFKGIREGGFSFFTNYESRKAKDLDQNPKASLAFYWSKFERQIRVEGFTRKLSKAESEKYFWSRPREKQMGAWASPQSREIQDREELEKKIESIQNQYQNTPTIPLPPHWGGYSLVPEKIEFWIGHPFRWHDRFLYTKADGNWKISRLAP